MPRQQEGVYDITDFIANHPGGTEKILMAAGASVDAYWQLYPQHYTSAAALTALARRRVGTLDPKASSRDAAARRHDSVMSVFGRRAGARLTRAFLRRRRRQRRQQSCQRVIPMPQTRRRRLRCGCTRASPPRQSLRWRC